MYHLLHCMWHNVLIMRGLQHPLWRNDRIVKHHERRGIHVVAYAPIGSPATMSNRGRKVPNLIEVGLAFGSSA